jgi:hypothetical protein
MSDHDDQDNTNVPALLPATLPEGDEVGAMLDEIEAVASEHDQRALELLQLAKELLRDMDDVKARVDAGEEEHEVLMQHFAVLADVTQLLSDLEASAPPIDELTSQISLLAVELAARTPDTRPEQS